MLLDHLGAVGFFGDASLLMRYVGRISFPIYAYLMATGFCFSKNKEKHIFFLGVFALISEVPFDLVHGSMYLPQYQNVIWTFFFASIAMYAIEKVRGFLPFLFALGVGGLCYFAAYIFNTDYSVYGFSLVLCMFVFERAICLDSCRDKIRGKNLETISWKHEREYIHVSMVLLVNLTTVLYFVNSSMTSLPVTVFGYTFSAQMFGMVSILPISSYILGGQRKVLVGKSSKLFKWFHYWFYPVHLLLLGFFS